LPRWNRFLDLPNDYAGEKAGFLGGGFDPWLVRAAPGGLSFRLDELALPADVPIGRLHERRDLLGALDRQLGRFGEHGQVHDALHGQACDLLGSSLVRRAFDLGLESTGVRGRYGVHPFGQGLLLARRLVEAGTTLVQVNWHDDGSDVKSPFWDTHQDNFSSLKNKLLPPVDVGLSALLVDLDERGLLASTLVLMVGEFGRSPKIGAPTTNNVGPGGRDHWPSCYTCLLAGGGVRAGQVFGESDRYGAYPQKNATHPYELVATLYHALGIDPASQYHDNLNRPRGLVEHGGPILGLF
jgi:Protein of unknown function (DUF1501)